jgi:hypothetical protein
MAGGVGLSLIVWWVADRVRGAEQTCRRPTEVTVPDE